MKYIKVILFILVLSWAMSVVAQDKEKTVEYWGWVEDYVTHTAINEAKVSLMDADGNLVKVETSNSRLNQNDYICLLLAYIIISYLQIYGKIGK